MLFILERERRAVDRLVRPPVGATGDVDPADRAVGLAANGAPGQVVADVDGLDRRRAASRTTTSTARRRPGFTPSAANRIAQPTAHELHRHRRSRRAPTTTRSPPTTPPATRALPRTRSQRDGAERAAARARGGLRLRRGQRARRPPTSPATATPARSRTPPGRPTGKFGNALSFNGTNAFVTVADSNSLDLTTGMTLEAWVKPTTPRQRLPDGRRQGAARATSSTASTRNIDTNRPQAQVDGARQRPQAAATARPRLAAGTWTHLAATYDGTTERLYVNGTLVSTARGRRRDRCTSTAPLKIGGNAIWGEYFSGLIDEVRVYNRALSAAEIQQRHEHRRSARPTRRRRARRAR